MEEDGIQARSKKEHTEAYKLSLVLLVLAAIMSPWALGASVIISAGKRNDLANDFLTVYLRITSRENGSWISPIIYSTQSH